MADFYQMIDKNKTKIPDEYNMTLSQLCEFVGSTASSAEVMRNVFKFGYLQGVRAERDGKAGI